MRIFSKLTVAIVGVLAACSWAHPVTKLHGRSIVIGPSNSINGTYNAHPHSGKGPSTTNGPLQTQGTAQLPLSIVNNFSGSSVNLYVTGLDDNNQLVMLQPDGSWFYPAGTNGTTIPLPITGNVAIPISGFGTVTNLTLPSYISSARIWFAEGNLEFYTVTVDNILSLVEPSAVNPDDASADVNWGFVELTNTEDAGIYANISYVDFVGLVLGMELLTGNGSIKSADGLESDAVAQICSDLQAQAASDGQPWDKLCVMDTAGNPLRVMAPTDYIGSDATAFSDYWSDYVDKVWTRYTNSTLTINTQSGAGNVNCTVTGDQLTCAGDNRGYSKPVASDIFGCNSGPFLIQASDNDIHKAVVPRLCAAFNRSTLLLSGGNVQPSLGSNYYYTVSPTNYYSKIVHKYESDGKGYAFSYDDVNPTGGDDQSGSVTDADPQLLTVYVGGPPSS
ncbi:CAZyme family GH64 [Paecilomyces variotii]|nr:CAZyme family GH64 [Paecilomyces variotii]KAJ9231063.1 CAZyme family GH64 [Paecilomyces variotii]KAJ9265470.1 CAZyme family GH64 [Paecilomyces variotii]KAJ9307587.1 CAZyme family GH64 [Paecilomyces variotii]